MASGANPGRISPRMSLHLPPPDLPPPSPPEKAAKSLPPPTASHSPSPAAPGAPTNPYQASAAPLPKTTQPAPEETAEQISDTMAGLVMDAFTYPVRRGGLSMIGMGAVIIFIASVSTYAGTIGLVACALCWSYIAAYFFEIINHTLTNRSTVPHWPELSNLMEDVWAPGLQMLTVILVSTIPKVLVAVALGDSPAVLGVIFTLSYWRYDDGLLHSFMWLAAMAGWAYFPMAALSVVWHGTLSSALPHRVLPAIIRCMPGYLWCAAAYAGIEILILECKLVTSLLPFGGTFLVMMAIMYGFLAQGRLIGLMSMHYHNRLPWGR